MSEPHDPRLLHPDDWLYRRVLPGQAPNEQLHAEAFEDGHENLSFYTARRKSPAQVLELVAGAKPVRVLCGTGSRRATAAEMYDAGYRIAKIRVRDILEEGFEFCPADVAGNLVSRKGHVDVRNGQQYAARWARKAVLLGRDETVGSR
jgi:hypothetical protein